MPYDYINFSCTLSDTPGFYITIEDCENAVNDGSAKPILILNPVWSASKKASLPLLINILGDGYQQTIFKGVDLINEEWSVTSPILIGSQVDDLLNQLRTLSEISFLWSPNNGVISYQEFTCSEWQKIRIGVNQYQITATFKMSILGSGLLISGQTALPPALLIHLTRDSYPGSGTIWNDLQNNHNFNLIGNFTSLNGEITFNGLNPADGGSYAASASTMSLPKNNQPLTIEIYVKSSFNNPIIVNGGIGNYVLKFTSTLIGIEVNSSGGNITLDSSINNIPDTYYHIVMTYNGTVVRLYRNSTLIAISESGRLLNNYNTTFLWLMGFVNNGVWANVSGSIKLFRLYTRALSDSEVLQNYNSILSAAIKRNYFKNAGFSVIQGTASGTVSNSLAVPTASLGYPGETEWCIAAAGGTPAYAFSSTNQSLTLTGASGTTAIHVLHRIESIDANRLKLKQVTLSVELSNNLLGNVTWELFRPTTTADTHGTITTPTQTVVASGTWTVTSTLTRYTATVTLPTGVSNGLEVRLRVGAQTSGTWVIARPKLEEGGSATAFTCNDYSIELQKCQRYFLALNGGQSFIWYGDSPTRGHSPIITFPVEMFQAPIKIAGWIDGVNAYVMRDTTTKQGYFTQIGNINTGAASATLLLGSFAAHIP